MAVPRQESQASGVPSGRLTPVEERVARGVVATHRSHLDWLLRVPDLESLFFECVDDLGLPGQRQGISGGSALLSLPIEAKHQLVRMALPRFRRHLPSAIGRRLCTMAGVEPPSTLDLEDMLTLRQWEELRDALLVRLAHDHRRYKHAQDLLFAGYRHVVEASVGQLAFSRNHRDDCRQEGFVGLLQAIDRVDASEASFGAFAASWVKRRMRNYLMQQRLPVCAPTNLVSRATAMARGQPSREAPASEVRNRLEVLLLECLRHPAVTLDEPSDPHGLPVAETLADAAAESPADAASREDVRALVGRSLGILTEKQRAVVERRYGLGAGGGGGDSLSAIARATGVSHQQVGQRERRALARLGEALGVAVSEIHGTA